MAYTNIIGVQFRRASRIYDFSPGEQLLRIGDDVVVDTERGPSLAKVVQLKYVDMETYPNGELKPIIRKASPKDLDTQGKMSGEEAMTFARQRVEKLGLNMRIMKAEAQFGGNKMIIYFSAPGRVDFRDLVKDLAGGLKARVELKQVGARDEAKLVGGVGICGREYCCSSFLREFVPVSIKMAKNQNLALNPSKVSGGCGRLLCCLTYENDTYSALRKTLPPFKSKVRMPEDGTVGQVIKADVLNQVVVIETAEGRQITCRIQDIEVLEKNAKGDQEENYDTAEAESWAEDIDLKMLE